MQNNYDRENITYAGFFVRLAAYALDSLIVAVLLLTVRLSLAVAAALLTGLSLDGSILFHYTLKDIILYVAQVCYFILFTYYSGTTPGKRLMNLRVVNADGNELSFTDVLYRETVGRFLSGIILNIGYIMIGVDKEKRALHDILCDTRVVYEKRIKVSERMRMDSSTPFCGAAPCSVPPQDINGPYCIVRPEDEQQERDSSL